MKKFVLFFVLGVTALTTFGGLVSHETGSTTVTGRAAQINAAVDAAVSGN